MPERTEGVVLEVLVRRGGMTESRHRVEVVVVDAAGRVLLASAASHEPVSLRSSSKPFQTLAALESGAFDAAGFDESELALACASHNGEPTHVVGVRRMLAKLGLDASALGCGVHPPMYPPAARALVAAGAGPDAAHNNCSGKHAGMLALARHLGAPLAGYVEAQHPVQRAILAAVERLAGVAPRYGVDGCGVPAMFLPLDRAARLYGSLARGASPELDRVFRAMAAHPMLVAGSERFDTALIEAFGGRAVSKMGAEGVIGVALRRDGDALPIGMFLKCVDGNERAVPPAALALLARLGVLDDGIATRLASFARGERTNHAGRVVGDVEVRIAAVEA